MYLYKDRVQIEMLSPIVALSIIVLVRVTVINGVKIDLLNCGIDHETTVEMGEIDVETYPWLGVLYYTYNSEPDETRAVAPVVLIQEEFVLAAAAEIGPMPKRNFRQNSFVLLGEKWHSKGRRVRNYVLHPEYGETLNTLALVQLKDPVRYVSNIIPLCPPPEILRNPEFFVVRFKDDYNQLKKEVISMSHVPGNMCKDFYIAANLYAKKMRPPHVVCAVSLETESVCVWEAGAVLVTRDVWGRWQLLGFGVRGPGCGAPSRYLDMLSYFPWIHSSLDKFQQLTISKITNQKYVLRSDSENHAFQRYGACDPEEQEHLVYREAIVLRTDNDQYQFLNYNMTIRSELEISCLTLELVNASASSEMKVTHVCPRSSYGPPCYRYEASIFQISVYLMFADKCSFEMFCWGQFKNLSTQDIMVWKWEEATYYEDFNVQRVEYRGPTQWTDFGYEPLDFKMWLPEYDVWTTTEFDNASWSSTTPPPSKVDGKTEEIMTGYGGIIQLTTTKARKGKFKSKAN